MDSTQIRTLVIVVFPALFGGTLIAMTGVICRMRHQQQRVVALEQRVGALETSAVAPLPPQPQVYQTMLPPPPSAPAADPLPPTQVVLPIYPPVQTPAPRYVAYI